MRPVSPAAVDPDQFTLSIRADGNPLDTDLLVLRVDIWSALDASAKAKVVMMAGIPPDEPFSTRIFQAAESGKAIEIRAGYELLSDVIFSGIVSGHEVDLGADGSSIVITAEAATVTVKDPDASQLPVLTVEYGVSIISFKAETKPGISRLSDLRGKVSFQGSALPTPGSMIELVGLGGHFNGNVFVTEVHHDIANGQWTTGVEFRRRPHANE